MVPTALTESRARGSYGHAGEKGLAEHRCTGATGEPAPRVQTVLKERGRTVPRSCR